MDCHSPNYRLLGLISSVKIRNSFDFLSFQRVFTYSIQHLAQKKANPYETDPLNFILITQPMRRFRLSVFLNPVRVQP